MNRTSYKVIFAVILPALCISPGLLDAQSQNNQKSQTLVDLAEAPVDTGVALDSAGRPLPDTGLYVPKNSKDSKAAQPVIDVLPAKTGKGESSKASPSTKPILRAEIEGIWSGTVLTGVRAKVRNAGGQPAKGVSVEAEVPGLDTLPLSGPGTIEPGQSESYTATFNATKQVAGNIKAITTCDNCQQ